MGCGGMSLRARGEGSERIGGESGWQCACAGKGRRGRENGGREWVVAVRVCVQGGMQRGRRAKTGGRAGGGRRERRAGSSLLPACRGEREKGEGGRGGTEGAGRVGAGRAPACLRLEGA